MVKRKANTSDSAENEKKPRGLREELLALVEANDHTKLHAVLSSKKRLVKSTMVQPLLLAAKKGYAECLKVFVDHHAHPDICDHNAVSALALAIDSDNTECVKVLLEGGCPLVPSSPFVRNYTGFLDGAVEVRNMDTVKLILHHLHRELEATNDTTDLVISFGRGLIACAKLDSLDPLQILLNSDKHVFDAFFSNKEGSPHWYEALKMAAKNNLSENVLRLLQCAPPEPEPHKVVTAISEALTCPHSISWNWHTHKCTCNCAADEKILPVVTQISEFVQGCNITQFDYALRHSNQEARKLAVWKGSHKITQLLLELSGKLTSYFDLLLIATRNGDMRMIRILLNHGTACTTSLFILQRCQNCDILFNTVAKEGHLDIMSLLLQAGYSSWSHLAAIKRNDWSQAAQELLTQHLKQPLSLLSQARRSIKDEDFVKRSTKLYLPPLLNEYLCFLVD